MVLSEYNWLLAIITIAFCGSSFGNGANDVANAYATSVAARTLSLWQVGILAVITEFVGAVALGNRVTGTIKNDVIDIDRFVNDPSVLILAMTCAEIGSATWLLVATRSGFPVSTTQTIVGALVGVGIASQADISWAWEKGSVSQVAASWGIAPILAGCFSAILFSTLKFGVLERKDSFEKAMAAIPVYLAFTGAVLALFITIEAPGAPSLEDLGAGAACGIIFGVFFFCLAISYIFFVPYFKARLIREDSRVRAWHIPLGPLLLRENPPLYWPGKRDGIVKDYYATTHNTSNEDVNTNGSETTGEKGEKADNPGMLEAGQAPSTDEHNIVRAYHVKPEPEERWLKPHAHLSIFNPKRIMGYITYFLFQGVSRDCVSHGSDHLTSVHGAAKKYDNRVEHLWTYAQVASAVMMSIAHGSNDVANAVGPWAAAYSTYQSGEVDTESETPVWMLIIAGFLLGAGFWFLGFHIIRSLGNKITQMSPTRGYASELGAAITVLLASRLGLPVSTTQCLTGAVLGVALMNLDFAAVNWRQLGFIFCGWVLTLPSAGLISGLLLVMALNFPQFS